MLKCGSIKNVFVVSKYQYEKLLVRRKAKKGNCSACILVLQALTYRGTRCDARLTETQAASLSVNAVQSRLSATKYTPIYDVSGTQQTTKEQMGSDAVAKLRHVEKQLRKTACSPPRLLTSFLTFQQGQ